MKIMKLHSAAAITLAGAAHAETLQLKRSAGDLIPSPDHG